jgi:hypothetical protein
VDAQEVDMNDGPPIALAVILIVIGLFFLAVNVGVFQDLDLEIDRVWPGIMILGGIAFWAQYLLGGTRDPGYTFVGTAALLLGLFFLLFSLNVELPFTFPNLEGPIDWEDNAYLWPAYPLIGGVAFVVLGLLARDRGALGVGLVAMAVGAIAFPFTLGRREGLEEIAQLWPVLLILVGGWALLRGLLRGRGS